MTHMSKEGDQNSMAKDDIFRKAMFGGYQKEDVMEYIHSLENENETIRILTKKENSSIKAELEKERTAGAELREALASLKKENKLLEEEKNRFLSASHTNDGSGQASDLKAEGQKTDKLDNDTVERLLMELKTQEASDREWRQSFLEREEKFIELINEMKKINELLRTHIDEIKLSVPEDAEPVETVEIAEPQSQPEPDSELQSQPEQEPETEAEDGPEVIEEVEDIEEVEEVGDVEEAIESVSEESGYHMRAYESLRDVRQRAAKLLSGLDDPRFTLG